MVKVEEVFGGSAAGLTTIDAFSSKHNDDEYEDISTTDADDETESQSLTNESFVDRIIALKDIIPYGFRIKSAHFFNNSWTYCHKIGTTFGQLAWIFTTSMILVGLPVLFAYDRERSLIEYEREQKKLE